jgi:hypothetical protein
MKCKLVWEREFGQKLKAEIKCITKIDKQIN